MTRRQAIGVAIALLGMVGAVVGAFVLQGDDSRPPPRPTAAELSAYEQAILPTVRDWGSVEVLGMRPAVADLRSGTGVPASTVVTEARAWTSSLRADREKLRAVVPPPGIEEAARLFDQSMAKYLTAAQLFGQAAARPKAERSALLDRGVQAASEGASIYNRASVVLQQAHRRIGQSPSPDFPDHL